MIGETAIKTLPGKIVERQSLSVDDIAGATNSSKAIKQAVLEALKKAGGDASSLKERTVAKAAVKMKTKHPIFLSLALAEAVWPQQSKRRTKD